MSYSLATRAENVSRDWHDLCECVNLASTRWINAIIGQTWRGENPFRARKAKQGPCLIHLANLWVMYECQGTLVRQEKRWMCVGSVNWLGVYFFFYGRGGLHMKMLFGCRAVSLRSGSILSTTPALLGVSVDKTNGAQSWKWQKDALSALSGREAGLLCKWGAETWLWSAGQQSDYQNALPYQELNQVLSAAPLLTSHHPTS